MAALLTAGLLLTTSPQGGAVETGPPDSATVETSAPKMVSSPVGRALRNPFAEPARHQEGTPDDTVREIVFDGSLRNLPSTMGSLRGRVLPRIRVRGIMEVAGRLAACAEVEDLGTVVLPANERILLSGRPSGPENAGSWFLVRIIDQTGMTIELDDGTLVQGKFF